MKPIKDYLKGILERFGRTSVKEAPKYLSGREIAETLSLAEIAEWQKELAEWQKRITGRFNQLDGEVLSAEALADQHRELDRQYSDISSVRYHCSMARRDGFDLGKSGAERTDNPYPEGSAMYESWERGFMVATNHVKTEYGYMTVDEWRKLESAQRDATKAINRKAQIEKQRLQAIKDNAPAEPQIRHDLEVTRTGRIRVNPKWAAKHKAEDPE